MAMPDLLTPAQAAQALNVSASTVRRWIASDKLRTVRMPGGRHYISAASIQSFIASAHELANQPLEEVATA